MTPAVAESTFADATREARVLAAKASEAVEDGLHAARRSYKIARRRADDAAGDVAAYIKKQPLMTVGVALGAGLVLGLAGGFILSAVSGRCAEDRT
jgi:ElaB/YqjD/DUF883 family membrane-anchored ribosome-binding protein